MKLQQPIVIEDEEQECRNSLYYVRYHPKCKNYSWQCEVRCNACDSQEHKNKSQHKRIQIQKFKQKFRKLEETSINETAHYLRQINQIEQNATRAIRDKKQQLIEEVQNIKQFIMNKTYKNLQTDYKLLYEKYTNQRFEKLSCYEVNWVMKEQPKKHQLKHSDLNTQLLKILKEFQKFQEVSKNMPYKTLKTPIYKKAEKKIDIKSGKRNFKELVLENVFPDKPDLNYQLQEQRYTQQIKKLKIIAQSLGDEINKLKQELDILKKLKQNQKINLKNILQNIQSSRNENNSNEKERAFNTKEYSQLFIQTSDRRIQVKQPKITIYIPNGKQKNCHIVIKGQDSYARPYNNTKSNLTIYSKRNSIDK